MECEGEARGWRCREGIVHAVLVGETDKRADGRGVGRSRGAEE